MNNALGMIAKPRANTPNRNAVIPILALGRDTICHAYDKSMTTAPVYRQPSHNQIFDLRQADNTRQLAVFPLLYTESPMF